MWLSALGIAIVVQILFDAPLSTATEFGCKDNLISDEWRQAILNFHNRQRRRVAQGQQVSQPTKVMPPAKDMNQVYWDCNIEYNAFLRNCDGNIALPQDFAEVTASIKLGANCNATERSLTILKNLWDNEVKLKDMSQNIDFDANTQKNFATMAYSKTTGIGCTYNKCSDKLLCLYNKKPAIPLYHMTSNCVQNGCTQGTSTCVDYLCHLDSGYTPDTTTIPQPDCAGGQNDGMTHEMQTLAEDMINYYRRLVGSGWAPDKTDYAPPAKKMTAVEYDCNTIGTDNKAIADDCNAQSYTNKAGYSLSSHKVTDLSKTPVEVLSEAIQKWAEQSKLVNLDGDVMYSGEVATTARDFANMMNTEASKVVCSVGDCTARGFKVAICQYNAILSPDDQVYAAGKPCSGCAAASLKCDNALGGGICIK